MGTREHTLNDRQREFLTAPRFGVLATIEPSGSPHLTVMWYALEGDEIVFNTTRERRKTANMVRDPRVSLLVFDGYTYVRVTGRVRETATGAEALEEIMRLAARYSGPEQAEKQRPHFAAMERVSFRFRIARVYASADLR